MDAFWLSICGRDRTFSTVLFEYGDRRVIAHVANDEHCELPAVFTNLRFASAPGRAGERAFETGTEGLRSLGAEIAAA